MKRKINISFIFSFFIVSSLFLSVNCLGEEFPWTMFLPSITGEFKICSADPQTKMWKGREWQRCNDGNEYGWETAKNYCQELPLGKYTDWRLPTKSELKSLVVCTNGHPVPLEDYHWCSDDEYGSNFTSPTIDPGFQSLATGYWSSTLDDADHAWFVNFVGGNAEVHNFQNGHYVRCVRSP